ncbi:MAG: lysylphosphatidylglycerol synthase transmembrane domain-containing protein [bacterium]
MKKRIIQIIVSIGLMTIILYQADLKEIGRIIKTANIPLIILSPFILFLTVFINSLKLKMLLSIQGICLSFYKTFCYQIIGAFFSNFLPGTIGGDVFQTYILKKKGFSGTKSAVAIMTTRFTEFIGMTTFFLIFLYLGYKILTLSLINYLAKIIFFILVFIFLFSICYWQIVRHSHRFHPVIGNAICKMHNAILLYSHHKSQFVFSLALSFITTFIWILTPYILSLSLGMKVSFFYFFIFIPLVYLISSIPISINGIGLREGTYTFLFYLVGVNKNIALSLGLLVSSLELFKALVGGFIYLVYKKALSIDSYQNP